jgi:cytochrome c
LLSLRKPYIFGVGLLAFAMVLSWSTLFVSGKAQTAGNGGALFEKRCGGCHALDRDKEGPRLGGVYGRVAGSVESFQYSAALKKSGIIWTGETLDKWLTDTEKFVPDSDMTFHLDKSQERSDIISFLKQNSSK